MRVISARCGAEISAAVVPVAIFNEVMQIVLAVEERQQAALEAMEHRTRPRKSPQEARTGPTAVI
jgi:hypothetical protein